MAETLDQRTREPIDPDHGDHMTWEDFKQRCMDRSFIDYDGMADRADETHLLPGDWIWPSAVVAGTVPDVPTHIVWYNR